MHAAPPDEHPASSAPGLRHAGEADVLRWSAWLANEIEHIGLDWDRLAAALQAHCRVERFERPSRTQIETAVTLASLQFEARSCERIAARLGAAAEGLEALLTDAKARYGLLLAELQQDVGAVSLGALIREIDELASVQALGLPTMLLAKLHSDSDEDGLEFLIREIDQQAALQALCLPTGLFDGVPAALVDAWRAQAARSKPEELLALPADVRLTQVAALCSARRGEITDMLVGVLIGLVDQLQRRAEHRLDCEVPRQPLSENERDALLLRLARTALESPDDTVRDALYPIVSEKSLRELLRDSERGEPVQARRERAVLRSTYSSYYQQVLLLVVGGLEFRCRETASWPIMAALGELMDDYTRVWGTARYYEAEQNIPVAGIVPKTWQSAVVDGQGRIERVLYQLCVLVSLCEFARRGKIYVAGASEWGTPNPSRAVEGAHRPRQPVEPNEIIAWPNMDDRRVDQPGN
ncbi:hypothetical protein MOQ72_01125 [Saccharopolyspora sp. K220]|uniref:hypothetical protein n=1 Tax=Saccharopolyspora soli TaxID=2926618 RepID=UPI001F5AC672|nr:hypothetical protein [Saccharopolyspora soli]MCI2416013.1 hypothetical protein [Saccharopolyspora soli]